MFARRSNVLLFKSRVLSFMVEVNVSKALNKWVNFVISTDDV